MSILFSGHFVFIGQQCYQAVFIVGGTGRNEPWDTREIISGHPQDIDIMLILKDKNSDTADAVSFVKEYLQPISLKYGLKLDILPPAKYSDFKKGPVNRFQYSVRYGKILWGSLNQNLLKYQVVNTNLSYSSFNEAILRRGSGIINFKSVYYDNDIQISSMIKKHITANVYKFVISCGDAILFALGRFAEIEKYRDILMQQSLEIPDDFKKLYKQALDFRKKRVFLPFEKMTKADLIKWINKSTCITSPVYLKFQEYHLLTDNLTWEGYPKKAVNKEFSTISAALGKTLLNNLKNYLSENISAPSVFEKISVEAARELISIIMPALIFDINNRYLNSMIMQMTCFNQEIKNIYKLYSNIYRQCCLKKDFDFLGLINSNKQ
ncbi:MAG: hypothetical protein GY730_10315 [bacterium]|nr:hypothetical protein [bacterium]